MSSYISKPLLGFLLAGGTGATVTGGYFLAKSQNIRERLVENHKNPLDVSNLEASNEDLNENNSWSKLLKKLISNQENINKLEVTLKSKSSEGNNENKKIDIKEIKRKCKELLETEYSEESKEKYKIAAAWCTKESVN